MQGKVYSMELSGKTLTIETGKYCEQAGGSAFVRPRTRGIRGESAGTIRQG